MGKFSSCSKENYIIGESQNNNNDSKSFEQQQKLNKSKFSAKNETAIENATNDSKNHHMKLRKRRFIEIDCEKAE
jgi:hypothetical protein